jgi:hypothetical protein
MTSYEVDILPADLNKKSSDFPLSNAITFAWTPDAPWAVTAVFQVGAQARTGWVFGIDLLRDGLLNAAGVGDVFVSPDPTDKWSTLLVLDAPSGRVGFRMPAEFIADFLADVDLVEVTPVAVDWDRELAEWGAA